MDLQARRSLYYMTVARFHSWVVLRTGGRPVHLSPRLRCLVLETHGRRSNQPRRVVLLYMPEGGDFVVLASNFGQEHPPAWWLNLKPAPDAVVQVGGRRVPVQARELAGEERNSVLERAMSYNKQWRSYATSLERVLPVVRLERRSWRSESQSRP